jgi:hypothetical protein
MRKLSRVTVALLATGVLTAATASSAGAAIGNYPPPCPVPTLIQSNGNGTVTIHAGCAASVTVPPPVAVTGP